MQKYSNQESINHYKQLCKHFERISRSNSIDDYSKFELISEMQSNVRTLLQENVKLKSNFKFLLSEMKTFNRMTKKHLKL